MKEAFSEVIKRIGDVVKVFMSELFKHLSDLKK